MPGQRSRSELKKRNKIFVVLGLVMVFLLWVAWIFGLVLADRPAAQTAASRR